MECSKKLGKTIGPLPYYPANIIIVNSTISDNPNCCQRIEIASKHEKSLPSSVTCLQIMVLCQFVFMD